MKAVNFLKSISHGARAASAGAPVLRLRGSVKFRFRTAVLGLAALGVAAIGLTSLQAASLTTEAESMKLPKQAGSVFKGTSASGGKALLIQTNASATRTVTTPATGKVTVRAKAGQCKGAPGMTLKIDGVAVTTTKVTATRWKNYSAAVNLPAGTHRLSIALTNDKRAKGCDRNLRIDKITFTEATKPRPVGPTDPIPPTPIPTPPPPASGPWNTYQGFNFTGWCNDCWRSSSATTSFNTMADMGGNSVSFPVYWYQNSKTSTSMYREGRTTSDAALIEKIQQAKAKGLKVMIRPILDSNEGWRGNYQPSDTQAWFGNYRNLINHYAGIAATHGADILEVGSEYNTLTRNSANDGEWRRVASEAKSRFPAGKTVYSANWDEFHWVGFFDAVDLISVDAYYPLAATSEGTLSEETILGRWTNNNGRNYVAEVADVQARFNKPVIFGEIGYGSRGGALEHPWATGGPYSAELQQNALNAAFRAFDNKSWFHGMFLWQWSYDPNSGGVGDTDHTPQRKPAEQNVRTRYMAS